jgi:proteic killer suppression protein
MIASFGDGATAAFFHGLEATRPPRWAAVANVAHRKLDMVNAGAKLEDLKVPPGNRLEALKGELAGYHSIRINDQWRVVFKWKDGGPHEVKIVDYH